MKSASELRNDESLKIIKNIFLSWPIVRNLYELFRVHICTTYLNFSQIGRQAALGAEKAKVGNLTPFYLGSRSFKVKSELWFQ